MSKDFALAALSIEDEEEWRLFLDKPFVDEQPVWPLEGLKTYADQQTKSTLTEKEKELIANYHRKTQQNKQVQTNSN